MKIETQSSIETIALGKHIQRINTAMLLRTFALVTSIVASKLIGMGAHDTLTDLAVARTTR